MSLVICSECGQMVSSLAKRCPHCGFPLVADSYPYASLNPVVNGGGVGLQHRVGDMPPCPDTHLVEAILFTIFFFMPLGIPAIVYAEKVKTYYNAGRYEQALYASGEAKKWCEWSLIVGLAMYAAVLLFSFLYLVFFISFFGFLSSANI